MNPDTPPSDAQPTPPGTTAQFLTRAVPAEGSVREDSGREGSVRKDSGREDHHAEQLAIEIARLFHDDKCTQVVVLDVRGLSPITNYLVIASGTSERQMRSVLDHAVELAEDRGTPPHTVTKDAGAHWLIADFVDVVAHVFEPNTRAHYDLEMLWGDAREIAWARPGHQ